MTSQPVHGARVALVTGGASGIGLACARRLQADGLQVAIATQPMFPRAAILARLRWADVPFDEFPYQGDTLNHVSTHPELTGAARRILGTADVALATSLVLALTFVPAASAALRHAPELLGYVASLREERDALVMWLLVRRLLGGLPTPAFWQTTGKAAVGALGMGGIIALALAVLEPRLAPAGLWGDLALVALCGGCGGAAYLGLMARWRVAEVALLAEAVRARLRSNAKK